MLLSAKRKDTSHDFVPPFIFFHAAGDEMAKVRVESWRMVLGWHCGKFNIGKVPGDGLYW
jgi:hypothetical protein